MFQPLARLCDNGVLLRGPTFNQGVTQLQWDVVDLR